MGNHCNYLLKREQHSEVSMENQKSFERDTLICLRYLLGLKASKRTEQHKSILNTKIFHIFNGFELVKEEEMKDLFDFEKLFADVMSKSKEKFRRLKIDHFGFFENDSLTDRDNKLLKLTRDLVCNFHCHEISSKEKIRSRYFFSLFSYLVMDPTSSKISNCKTSAENYIFCGKFTLDKNIVENLNNLFEVKQDFNLLLNYILLNQEKEIHPKLYKLTRKYFKLFLSAKDNNIKISEKYIKISKTKMREMRDLVKDRCVGDFTIEEDFQDKLKFILEKIAPKKENSKNRQKDDRMPSTSAGTNDSFQNGLINGSLKKNENLQRKTTFKFENRDFDKMPFDLNNILENESPNKSANTSYLQYQPTNKKGNRSTLKKIEIKDNKTNKVYSILQPKGVANTLKLDFYSYFSGEVDSHNFHFVGIGNLFKADYYFYKGTFIKSKKNGYGYIFKQDRNGNYYFYSGEWEKNEPNGFGVCYIVPKESKTNLTIKTRKFMRGKFKNGKFLKGTEIVIKEEEHKVVVERYQGAIIENDSYKSGEKLYRTIFKIEDGDKGKIEVESYYFYQGGFKGRLEKGKGISVKTFPELNYRYYFKGEFENGQMNGEGTILFEGNFFVKKYEGLFEKDKWFCHYGKVFFRSGDIYEGFFDAANCKDTVGVYLHCVDNGKTKSMDKTTKNTTQYTEIFEFSENEFDSLNKFMTHCNVGDAFFGEFYNDKKHGMGKYIFRNEKLLTVGRYLDGERNGKFDTVKIENIEDIKKESANNFSAARRRTAKFVKFLKVKKYYLIENDEIIDDSDQPFNN